MMADLARMVHPHVRGAQVWVGAAGHKVGRSIPTCVELRKMTCENRSRYLPATFTTKRPPSLTHPYHTPTEPTRTHEHPTDFNHPRVREVQIRHPLCDQVVAKPWFRRRRPMRWTPNGVAVTSYPDSALFQGAKDYLRHTAYRRGQRKDVAEALHTAILEGGHGNSARSHTVTKAES